MNFAADKFSPERFGVITGSRCSPLVPKKSADVGQMTLAKQLANEMYFEFYDEFGNWRTEHGSMAEHFALQHYQKYFDSKITEGRWLKNGDIGGNTDAEADDYGADWKCPTSLEKWLDYLYKGESSDEYNQCQLYMMLTGKKRWLIGAYLLETLWMSDNGLTYPVPHDKRMIVREVKASDAWVNQFNESLPTVIEMRGIFYKKLEEQFGTKQILK
jgi:hypothetical protein